MPRKFKRKVDLGYDILLFSDMQIDEVKGSGIIDGKNAALAVGLSVLDQIKEICIRERIKVVFFLGDLHEKKDRIPNSTLLPTKKKIQEIAGVVDEFVMLVGNHDFSNEKYPNLELYEGLENITVIKSPTIASFEGVQGIYGFIPFIRDQQVFYRVLGEQLADVAPDLICFHQDWPGASISSSITKENDLPGFMEPLLGSGSLLVSGHIHKTQEAGPVLYLGSPYQASFKEEGYENFVWLYSSCKHTFKPTEIEAPKHVTLRLSPFVRSQLNHRQANLEDKRNIEGNHIRLKGAVRADHWKSFDQEAMKREFLEAGALSLKFKAEIRRDRRREKTKEAQDIDYLAEYVKSTATKKSEREMLLGWGEALLDPDFDPLALEEELTSTIEYEHQIDAPF